MKNSFILLISVTFSTLVSLNAQDGTLPPMPGFVTPSSSPDSAQEAKKEATAAPGEAVPVTSEGTPEASDTDATNASPDLATTTGEPTAPGVPAAPGDVPPGLPGMDPAGGTKKVDFLQRSNLILAKLLDSERAVDPFGMVMDPANAKSTPMLADQYQEVEEAPTLNNSSLKSALLTLPITGVYPQRELLVLGARSFNVGDQFGMKLQDLTIRLRFEGIKGGEIYFKDMETREITSIPFNPRPAEFEPIAKGSKREIGAGILPMGDLFIVN